MEIPGQNSDATYALYETQKKVLEKELQLLRKLNRQMRANVESRARAPKWLVNSLNSIADAQGKEDVKPGLTYGSNPKYEQL